MKRYICYLTYFVFGIVFLSNTQAQYFTAPGVGYEGQGADIAFYSIDDNPALELFAFAYDHVQGGNTIRYRIGWNINSYGYTDIWSSKPIYGPSLGHEGQGLGAIITQIDDNPRPDMIVMVYDNPEGPNTLDIKSGGTFNQMVMLKNGVQPTLKFQELAMKVKELGSLLYILTRIHDQI